MFGKTNGNHGRTDHYGLYTDHGGSRTPRGLLGREDAVSSRRTASDAAASCARDRASRLRTAPGSRAGAACRVTNV